MEVYQNLDRFVSAQLTAYTEALEEIRNGRKVGHWMWYIFPQLRGLGQSNMAWYYGIEDLDEAKAYLAHPVLGVRLREISVELLKLPESNAGMIFGWTDSMKLRSCMTLFAIADESEPVFQQVLDKFYQGEMDAVTTGSLK